MLTFQELNQQFNMAVAIWEMAFAAKDFDAMNKYGKKQLNIMRLMVRRIK